jgi:hypothetical protein
VCVQPSKGTDVHLAGNNVNSIRIHVQDAHLDELGARAQEIRRIVNVLDDLHRTNNIEPPWFPYELFDCPMSKDEIGSEGRVRRGMGRRDADILLGRVDGKRIGA